MSIVKRVKRVNRIFKVALQMSLLTTASAGMAQLPECEKMYFDRYTLATLNVTQEIYTYDPFLPVSATNPALNTISRPPGLAGLAVSKVLGSASNTRTFYAIDVNTDLLWYCDPVTLTWVNTGHQVGSGGQTANLGAGGDYLYSCDPINGEVYRYDGTGNAVLITTVADWALSSGSVYDITADCDGNFYLLKTRGTLANQATYLRKYSPTGILLQSWAINGNPALNSYGYGGFRIMSNMLYTDARDPAATSTFASGVQIVAAPMTSTGVNFANATVSPPLPQYQDARINDWGTCDITDLLLPEITIAASETELCGTRAISLWVNSLENQGNAPAYQWLVNGVLVPGATDSIFTYTPQNGDAITCRLTSSEQCILIC